MSTAAVAAVAAAALVLMLPRRPMMETNYLHFAMTWSPDLIPIAN